MMFIKMLWNATLHHTRANRESVRLHKTKVTMITLQNISGVASWLLKLRNVNLFATDDLYAVKKQQIQFIHKNHSNHSQVYYR